MKVFSKSNKNNKSTPLLPQFNELNTSKQVTKPKGISKVTNYKSKLLQSSNEQSVKFEFSSRIFNSKDYENCPKSSRQYEQDKKSIKLQKSFDIDSRYNTQTQSIPLTNSIQYKNNKKNDIENRSYSESIEKIQSVLCYGNKLPPKQKITPFDSNKSNKLDCTNNSQKSKSSKKKGFEDTKSNGQITSFKILAQSMKYTNNMNSQQQNIFNKHNTDKQNRIQNVLICNNQKENNKKQINYYKNSKLLNQYAIKPIQKKPSMDLFKLGRKLGKGRFGSVFIAQQIKTGMIFALKMIDLNQVKEQQMESQLIEQIKLQMFMDHPNILKMYGFFKEGQQLCMILQYADQKCLYGFLQQKLSEKQVAYFARQMIEALKYCHSQSILHRDLKPQNILLCRGVAKLADFGWAAYAPKYKRVTFCGTLDYVPPQILKGDYYDQKVDIWSLGVLIYEMSTGRAPFQSKSINPVHVQTKTMNKIKKGEIDIPSYLSIQLRNLIYSILMTEPEKRLSLLQIQNNAWLRNYKEVGTEISSEVWQFWAGDN